MYENAEEEETGAYFEDSGEVELEGEVVDERDGAVGRIEGVGDDRDGREEDVVAGIDVAGAS